MSLSRSPCRRREALSLIKSLWERVRRALVVAIPISGFAAPLGHAMTMVVAGDQLILTGPVTSADYDAVESNLSFNPQIKMVILRNSPGGDAPTGYHLGELFRQKSLQTAVSGYCYSSCSRLFLGGNERYFTDDYPPEFTQVGLHGHYDNKGNLNAASVKALHLNLNAASVKALHLKDWTIRHSDGKADEALVEGGRSSPVATPSSDFSRLRPLKHEHLVGCRGRLRQLVHRATASALDQIGVGQSTRIHTGAAQ